MNRITKPDAFSDCATPNRVDMEQVMNHLFATTDLEKATVLT